MLHFNVTTCNLSVSQIRLTLAFSCNNVCACGSILELNGYFKSDIQNQVRGEKGLDGERKR